MAQPTPEIEASKTMEVLALFSNRFHFIVGPTFTRITFGESLDAGVNTKYRTAITIPTSDAKDLAEKLTATIAKISQKG